jgi:hypothetical protein
MALEAGLGVPLVPSVSMSLQLGSNKWTFNQKIRANGLGGNHSAALMESTDESWSILYNWFENFIEFFTVFI